MLTALRQLPACVLRLGSSMRTARCCRAVASGAACVLHTAQVDGPACTNVGKPSPAMDAQKAPIQLTLSSILRCPKNTTAAASRQTGAYSIHVSTAEASPSLLVPALGLGCSAATQLTLSPFHQLPRKRCSPNMLRGSTSCFLLSACFSTSHRATDCRTFSGIQTAGNTQFGGVQVGFLIALYQLAS